MVNLKLVITAMPRPIFCLEVRLPLSVYNPSPDPVPFKIDSFLKYCYFSYYAMNLYQLGYLALRDIA